MSFKIQNREVSLNNRNMKNAKVDVTQKRNPDAVFHFNCANMANNCYLADDLELARIKEIKKYAQDNWNGFRAKVYETDKGIIIAYAGTNSIGDYWSDLQMTCGIIPNQYDDAIKLYLKVANDPENKNKKIYVTGHSLGGSLAQLVASTTKYKNKKIIPPSAITFNAYGQRKVIDKTDQTDAEYILEDLNNTTNYFIQGDTVSGENKQAAIRNQPGKVILFDDELHKRENILHKALKPISRHNIKYGADRKTDLMKYHTLKHYLKKEGKGNYEFPIVLREKSLPAFIENPEYEYKGYENGCYFQLKNSPKIFEVTDEYFSLSN